MTDWRPIETAPRDGTSILVWTGHAINPTIFQAAFRYGIWSANGCEAVAPSHWKPLPEPPRAIAPPAVAEKGSK